MIHDKAICGGKAQYTSSPTNAPTLAPSSKAPTHAPTNVPTEATKEPTDTPTDTNAPTTQTPTTGAPTAASTTGTPTDPPTSNVSATKSPSTWQQGWREWFEMEESQIILGGSGALFTFLILALCAFCRARRHSKTAIEPESSHKDAEESKAPQAPIQAYTDHIRENNLAVDIFNGFQKYAEAFRTMNLAMGIVPA